MGLKVYENSDAGRHFLIPSNHQITPQALKIAFKMALANGIVKKASHLSRTKLLDVCRMMFQSYGDQIFLLGEPEVSLSDQTIRDTIRQIFPELHVHTASGGDDVGATLQPELYAEQL